MVRAPWKNTGVAFNGKEDRNPRIGNRWLDSPAHSGVGHREPQAGAEADDRLRQGLHEGDAAKGGMAGILGALPPGV